jgi:predicted aspartyl protease
MTKTVRLLIANAALGMIPIGLGILAPRSDALNAQAPPPTAQKPVAQPGTDASPGATVHATHGVELQATINGQGPFDAVLDTGSTNIMTASLVKRLGLKPEGSGAVNAGGSVVAAQDVTVKTVNIGGLTMSDQTFAVLDSPVGAGQDGIMVGFGLLQALPIRVDFEKQQITFYDPQRFKYSGNGDPIPIHYQDGFVVAEGSIDGIPGVFSVDTGDMYSFTLYAPFVKQHNLVAQYGATFQGYAGQSWGGPMQGFYARAHILQLGKTSVSQPITFLSTDTQGAGASQTIAGNIGLGVLKHFSVVFDYPHGKMYLEKNSSYGEPDVFNRVGLVLDPDPDRLAIKTVIPGSPGAVAGLKEEDVITQIDGQPPTDDTLWTAFTQPVGTAVRLTVRSGAATRTISLILKEIL